MLGSVTPSSDLPLGVVTLFTLNKQTNTQIPLCQQGRNGGGVVPRGNKAEMLSEGGENAKPKSMAERFRL